MLVIIGRIMLITERQTGAIKLATEPSQEYLDVIYSDMVIW